MGLSLPRELFVTDLKNVSPWEVNVAPALAGVPAHPRRIRHFSLLIPSQQQGSNAAFTLGRKWKPITLRWMLQCEVAREKQTHVLYPTSHIPCSTSHSAANPHAVSHSDSMGAHLEVVYGKQLPPNSLWISSQPPPLKKEHFPALASSPKPAASFG